MLFYQIVSVAGDNVFLVGGDHNDGHLGVGGAEDEVFTHNVVVLGEVDFDAEAFHVFEDGTAHEPGVLTNAAGEEEKVASTHFGHVATDVAFYTLGKHKRLDAGIRVV